MTHRLYYTDPTLTEFDAQITDIVPSPRPALVLDSTAFYPTSGGQIFDTGTLRVGNRLLTVTEVAEDEDSGRIVHFVEGELGHIAVADRAHGTIDVARRRDHIQQHSGQHVLSAAFIQLFKMATVSFHMGAESCTIDLATPNLSREQIIQAEELANHVVFEDRPVSIRFVKADQAQELGLRKIPELGKAELRLIDIQDFDLTACGGTHVARTGEIGAILLRKTEKTKQGVRVEFVCGVRALHTARKDYESLNQAAELFSAHIWDVPQQLRKMLDDVKAERKSKQQLLEELAHLNAQRLLGEAPEENGIRVISHAFPERDLSFIKLVAQQATRSGRKVIVFLGCGTPSPGMVFAQTPGLPFDMSAQIKQATALAGGRGGGTKDLAQGGAQDATKLQMAIAQAAEQVRRGT